MNILWLVNIPLPEASMLLNQTISPYGGWLVNTSAILSDQVDINLSIVFPQDQSKQVIHIKGNRIDYYAFSQVSNRMVIGGNINLQLKEILQIAKPDLVHIFGTEYSHSLSMVNTCNYMNIKTIISIQGLVSIYSKHFMANLPSKIQKRFTLRDFIKQDNLSQQQYKLALRGKFEIMALERTQHIIGRTTWDRACTEQINPNAEYHFCDEILREEFYEHQWDLRKCERFSVFISQASRPIKGFHFMLEAMPLILDRFPDAKLYISGPDITKSNTLKEKLKKTSYAKYIIELINKYNLEKNIIFTGLLDEKQMCERYLKSNVFVCPSSIENSPNSLGEAMALGVPCVASDVGGVSDMLRHRKEGYVYQTDAPYMLAYYICEIFKNEERTLMFSKNAREHALETHDKQKNTKDLIDIYNKIHEVNK